MADTSEKESDNSKDAKPAITLPGTVEKIIPPLDPRAPEKAQIAVEGADYLYREVRVDNTLQDASGREVSLKPGAQVEVTIEAEPESTIPKQPGAMGSAKGVSSAKD